MRPATAGDPDDLDVEEAVRAVFTVMANHIAPGELDAIKHTLPDGIRKLWRGAVAS